MKVKLLSAKFSLICFFIFISVCSYAQRASEQRIQNLEKQKIEKLFASEDKYFDSKDYGEKYKNASGVVLAQKITYTYEDNRKVFKLKESIRKRILLLDQAIVDQYSIFYFIRNQNQTNDANVPLGMRIEKPNGTKTIVDLKDALKVDQIDESKGFLTSNIRSLSNNYKIAIPNLQVGDIIDIITENTYQDTYSIFYKFPALIISLNQSIPIVKQQYTFILDRGFYLNYRCTNGAPDLKKDNLASDRKLFVFKLESENNDVLKPEMWQYDYRIAPTIKFQVTRSVIGQKSLFIINDKPDVPKTEISGDEIAKFVADVLDKKIYVDRMDLYTYSKTDLKIFTRNITNQEEYAKACYYYLRHKILVGENILYAENSSISDYSFMLAMAEALKERNVDFEVFVAPPKYLSPLEEVISIDELSYIIKVKDKYLSNFSHTLNYGDFPFMLSNVNAYRVKFGNNKNDLKGIKEKLPALDFHDSYYNSVSELEIKPDFNIVQVKQKIDIKGHLKNDFAPKVLQHYDFNKKGYLLFNGKPKIEVQGARNKVRQADEDRSKKASEDENIENQTKVMKTSLESDFKVDAYHKFTLIEPGNSDKSEVLKYQETYDLKDIIQKVGSNYIFKLGNLLGQHISFSNTARERSTPIYINYPKTYSYSINLILPDGFKATGIEDFNQKVENQYTYFESKIKVENSKLTLLVNKSYKTDFVPKEDWNDILKFTDAAFDLTQKKIILKKQ